MIARLSSLYYSGPQLIIERCPPATPFIYMMMMPDKNCGCHVKGSPSCCWGRAAWRKKLDCCIPADNQSKSLFLVALSVMSLSPATTQALRVWFIFLVVNDKEHLTNSYSSGSEASLSTRKSSAGKTFHIFFSMAFPNNPSPFACRSPMHEQPSWAPALTHSYYARLANIMYWPSWVFACSCFLRTNGTHQWIADSVVRSFATTKSARWTGKASFNSASSSGSIHELEPSFHLKNKKLVSSTTYLPSITLVYGSKSTILGDACGIVAGSSK